MQGENRGTPVMGTTTMRVTVGREDAERKTPWIVVGAVTAVVGAALALVPVAAASGALLYLFVSWFVSGAAE